MCVCVCVCVSIANSFRRSSQSVDLDSPLTDLIADVRSRAFVPQWSARFVL